MAFAGLAIARQRPSTANGIVFMLLEDEHGHVNLVVQPDVYERHRAIVRAEPLLLVRGRFELRGRPAVVAGIGIETPEALIKEADPELERLLAEEEEIERSTRQHNETPHFRPGDGD